MTATLTAAPPIVETDNPHHERRWWILAVLGIAQLMVVLDTTVVNIALPSAQRSLGFDDGDRQWIVTGYALAFGSLLLLGGRMADLFGRKRLFLIGLIGRSRAVGKGPLRVDARDIGGGEDIGCFPMLSRRNGRATRDSCGFGLSAGLADMR